MPNVVIPTNWKYHTVLAEKTPTSLTTAEWNINVSMHRMKVNNFLLSTKNATENVTLFISTYFNLLTYIPSNYNSVLPGAGHLVILEHGQAEECFTN